MIKYLFENLWKCCLHKGSHFDQALTCLYLSASQIKTIRINTCYMTRHNFRATASQTKLFSYLWAMLYKLCSWINSMGRFHIILSRQHMHLEACLEMLFYTHTWQKRHLVQTMDVYSSGTSINLTWVIMNYLVSRFYFVDKHFIWGHFFHW